MFSKRSHLRLGFQQLGEVQEWVRVAHEQVTTFLVLPRPQNVYLRLPRHEHPNVALRPGLLDRLLQVHPELQS